MKNLIVVIAMLCSVSCYAQDKGYVGLTFGASNPLGEFGDSDIDNEDAGFAQTGMFYDLSFGYKFGKNFGIAAMLRGQANPVDVDEIASQIHDEFSDFLGTDDFSVKAESDPISSGLFMVGGYGSFPLTEKLSFESRVLIGLMSATIPEAKITVTDGVDTYWQKQHEGSGSAFAFGLGAGLKFDIGNRICLLANLDYTTAKPEFKDVEFEDGSGDIETDTYSQSISTLNVGVGIAYRL